eukprot:16110373-Heterocapsa_arctica.AAC.1
MEPSRFCKGDLGNPRCTDNLRARDRARSTVVFPNDVFAPTRLPNRCGASGEVPQTVSRRPIAAPPTNSLWGWDGLDDLGPPGQSKDEDDERRYCKTAT